MVTLTRSDGLPGVISTMPPLVSGMITGVQPVRLLPYSTAWVVVGCAASLRLYSNTQSPAGFVRVGWIACEGTSGAPPSANSIMLETPSLSGSAKGLSFTPGVSPCKPLLAQVS